MSSRRKRPVRIHNSAEVLRRIEDLHHFASRTSAEVRVGAPHYAALSRMTQELRTAYLAISGADEVPWASRSTGFISALGERALPDCGQRARVEPGSD